MKEYIIKVDHPYTDGMTELIRCKDCKYRPKQTEPGKAGFTLEFPYEYKCPCECDDGYYSWYPDDNWFCAYGEPKDGEQE